MKNKPLSHVITVNPDGELCFDNQVVDFDSILFEEKAKNLLESELLEGPLNYYPEQDSDESLFDEDDFENIIDDDESFFDDEDITSGDSDFYDISNDDSEII